MSKPVFWFLCAVFHPRLFLKLIGLRLWSVWLDIKIWRLQRTNKKLRAEAAELQARIAIFNAAHRR